MIPGTQALSKIGKGRPIEHVLRKLMSTSDPCACARLCLLKDTLHDTYCCSKQQEIGKQMILAGTKNLDSVYTDVCVETPSP